MRIHPALLFRPLKRVSLLAPCLLVCVGTAQAGTVSLNSFNGGLTMTDSSPGFVQLSFSDSRITGIAHADEYTGGVGAFATATGRFAGMAAQASASYITSFTVQCEPAPGEQTCDLGFPIVVTGDATAFGGQNSNPNVWGSAQAVYKASWLLSVGRNGAGPLSISGGGDYIQNFLDNGTSETVVVGTPFTATQHFNFEPGDVVTLSLKASAGAFTDPSGFFAPDMGMASATANFSNTLRWGGVTSALSATGQPLNMSAVHLLGADGHDYVNAAGPNPFATPVPEPAAWICMLAGMAWLAARRPRPDAQRGDADPHRLLD